MKYLFIAVLFLTACQKETLITNPVLVKMTDLSQDELTFDMLWIAAATYPVARPEITKVEHIKYEFNPEYMATIGANDYRIEYLCHYSPEGDTCYLNGLTTSYWMAGDTLCSSTLSYENVSAWGIIKSQSKRWVSK